MISHIWPFKKKMFFFINHTCTLHVSALLDDGAVGYNQNHQKVLALCNLNAVTDTQLFTIHELKNFT